MANFEQNLGKAARARLKPGQFFVNIGANDGVTGDPLFPLIDEFNLSGIAVEPNPMAASKLRENFAHRPDVIIVEAAIASFTGTTPLHIVDDDTGDFPWISQISSLREHYVKETLDRLREGAWLGEIPPSLDSSIRTVEVPCLTFESLLDQHGRESFDILNLDAETYDFEILQSIDLERHLPALAVIEDAGMQASEKAATHARFEALGYLPLQIHFPFSQVFGRPLA